MRHAVADAEAVEAFISVVACRVETNAGAKDSPFYGGLCVRPQCSAPVRCPCACTCSCLRTADRYNIHESVFRLCEIRMPRNGAGGRDSHLSYAV